MLPMQIRDHISTQPSAREYQFSDGAEIERRDFPTAPSNPMSVLEMVLRQGNVVVFGKNPSTQSVGGARLL